MRLQNKPGQDRRELKLKREKQSYLERKIAHLQKQLERSRLKK
jgi:hypothetical protein